MAIDTRAKRQSAHRVADPFARILPLADGTIDQADRQHHAGFYGGILAILGLPGKIVTLITIIRQFISDTTVIFSPVGADTRINHFISDNTE